MAIDVPAGEHTFQLTFDRPKWIWFLWVLWPWLAIAGWVSEKWLRMRYGSAGSFVIRESWHPRWTATLDGEPARIRRVTPDYMAIDVPAGEHTFQLDFDRPKWIWFLWVLWPWLAISGWVAEKWLRMRATATPPRDATAS